MIPLSKPYITEDDVNGVVDVLKSDRLSMGPKLEGFEKDFSDYIGVRHAIGVNSGTSALHLCVKAAGIGRGDEIITSPFSFVASANCCLFEGALPKFIDVEEESFNMDMSLLEAGERTKGLIPVHIFGQSCDIEAAMRFAQLNNLKVIEDACESLGATRNGRKVGGIGDAGVFAFYPNKQITTGEGGIVLTDDDKIAALCKSLRNQGRGDSEQWLVHDRLGHNYRMDEMSASLGGTQLNKVDEILAMRREIARIYNDEFEGFKGLRVPKIMDGNTHSWFVYPLRVEGVDRNKVVNSLNNEGIQSKAYFDPPIHLQPFYMKEFGYRKGQFPVAEKLADTTFIIPMYPQMTENDIRQVILTVKKVVGEIR